MIKNILFDLDGTLLVMKSQDKFIKFYFEALCKRFCKQLGLSPEQLTNGVWQGTKAMFFNDGKCMNRDIFWKSFSEVCSEDVLKYEKDFDDFYSNEFSYAKQTTSENPLAQPCAELLKEKGYRLILATNPVFPLAATANRVKWAGMNPEIFEYITVYDNSSYCKPNPKYYEEIAEKLNLNINECLMVGNDVDEDMCTAQMGMETYLVTDCLENKNNKDYSYFRQGTFKDFYDFAKNLPDISN
ncbi:MAG: HAD-IA family hydrolase [Oscillospiraceae bacterium]|nr:HAD-IA family hydrolase [Oscillospiraceae bacterium]